MFIVMCFERRCEQTFVYLRECIEDRPKKLIPLRVTQPLTESIEISFRTMGDWLHTGAQVTEGQAYNEKYGDD